jgi:N-acyl-D-amino-acid deacylase
LLLVEEGMLSLDDHPFTMLSDLAPVPGKTRAPALAQITVRHLLQHTGGWNRDSEAVGDPMFRSQTIAAALGAPGPADATMVIRYMLDRAPTYAPGSTYCYSNFGYAVLGRVIERVTGMPYDQYVASRVLAPAGIAEMAIGRTRPELRAEGEVRYFAYPGQPLAARSVFPDVAGAVPWPYGGFYLEAMDAHGGWIASPIDFVRFAATIDGLATPADQLSAASRGAMRANPAVPSCTATGGTTPPGAGSWYGFGLQVNRSDNAWHTGSLDGTATEDVIASNGFSWAAFFNTRPQSAGFTGRLDADLWTALDGAGAWTAVDLFPSYPAFSAWLDEAAFAAELDRQRANGRVASRVEGRASSGARQYRARFGPVPAGESATSAAGLDCVDYRARDAAELAAGRHTAGVQVFVDGAGVRRYQASWASF